MRKVLKIMSYVGAGIFLLLLAAIVYLNTQWGQNLVRTKAEAFLYKKLKTKVHIGHLGYGLPKYVVLDDVLFLDETKDTLLYAGELKIDLSMLELIHKKVDIQEILFKSVHAHIYRNQADTTYNFSYIVNAFTGKPKDPNKPKDTSSATLNIDLDRVKLDYIHVRFDDYAGGMRLAVDLDHLDLRMKKIDLDQMLFHIKDLTVSGLQTSFSQDTSYLPKKPDNKEKAALQLIADNLNVDHVEFNYSDALQSRQLML